MLPTQLEALARRSDASSWLIRQLIYERKADHSKIPKGKYLDTIQGRDLTIHNLSRQYIEQPANRS
jgi:hypothetical protein